MTTTPHSIRPMIRSLAWDLGLPVATYYALHALGAGDFTALLAGTLAAGSRMAWVAVRDRSLSPFSAVMAAVFGVGLVFTLVTGDPRWMLIKHSAMAAVLGLVFIATALRGRPLTLAAQQSFLPRRAAELASAYATDPHVRRGHRVSSFVWGAGLLVEALVRAVLVYTLPIEVMVGLSTALTIVTFAALTTWNARYIATAKRRAAPSPEPAGTSATAIAA
ncbi:VC0807 family protein [Actinoplanes sp. NPDC051633]|uniref:VC0807 family protein n=1 Tax=Actinoplanes sp. NPDC051633 TaxID=3155670 RepID=UPI0034121AD5